MKKKWAYIETRGNPKSPNGGKIETLRDSKSKKKLGATESLPNDKSEDAAFNSLILKAKSLGYRVEPYRNASEDGLDQNDDRLFN